MERENSLLIGGYLAGDEEAIEQLFSKYQKKVYAYLLKATHSPHTASDLLQDAFLKALRSIRKGAYVDAGRFEPWLMRIVRNVVLDHHRRTMRVNALFAREEQLEGALRGQYEARMESEAPRRRLEVRALVQRLPQAQREVVILRHYLGLSFQEIAEHTEVSINTALGRMRYALLNMRKMAAEQNLQLESLA